MKAFCYLTCRFPIVGEDGPISVSGVGPNPATAVATAIEEADAVYGRCGWEDRQSLLTADPDSLRLRITVNNSSGICELDRGSGYRVQFHYSVEACKNPNLAAKQCKNLLEFANNTTSGFLAEYAKWLMGKRRESKKGGNTELC